MLWAKDNWENIEPINCDFNDKCIWIHAFVVTPDLECVHVWVICHSMQFLVLSVIVGSVVGVVP